MQKKPHNFIDMVLRAQTKCVTSVKEGVNVSVLDHPQHLC